MSLVVMSFVQKYTSSRTMYICHINSSYLAVCSKLVIQCYCKWYILIDNQNLYKYMIDCKATGHSTDHDKNAIITTIPLIILTKKPYKQVLILLLMVTANELKQHKIFEIVKVESHKKITSFVDCVGDFIL